jgi:putative flippase GtrA
VRWLKFNVVGAAGIVLHLGLLALFVHVLQIHPLLSTALAIEAAILHKFYWHRRWTWGDRCCGGGERVLSMFLRFNLACGVVSIGGSLLSVHLLTRSFGLDPVLSNLLALAPCALLNFLICDWLIFVGLAPARHLR